MADKIIPTPWGMLIDVNTREPIEPATRDQWAQSEREPAALLTLAHGTQAYVAGGPDMLDCGHATSEHVADWRDSMEAAAALVSDEMKRQTVPEASGGTEDDMIGGIEPRTLMVLTVLLTALNRKAGIDSRSCVEFLFRRGLIGAAGTLSGVEMWADGAAWAWDEVASRVHLVTPEEWGAILALTAYAAKEADMTAEDVHEFAVSLVDDSDENPGESAA